MAPPRAAERAVKRKHLLPVGIALWVACALVVAVLVFADVI